MILGELINQLDQHEISIDVLATLDPKLSDAITERASILSMSPPDFIAGAVREFVDWADDNQWAQLLTHMKKADDPGLMAVQMVLYWVVRGQESG
jgi:hypothetical protein